MCRRFDEIFATCGWRVGTLKYGKQLEAAFKEKGGDALKAWIDDCGNADYAALTYLGGAAWRERLLKEASATKPILDAHDDEALHRLMTNRGGPALERSEERRVGKEWVRTCRSRWSRDH